jgi:5'-phosphate synthase pdxT subunit
LHLAVFRRLEIATREVRLPQELEGLSGLVIPGGESTAIGLLAREYGLLEPLREFGRTRAVWGTCAGAILLSRETGARSEARLGLLDVTVLRNAFGRQVQSFRVPLRVPILACLEPGHPRIDRRRDGIPQNRSSGEGQGAGFPSSPSPFPGIFIRAPLFDPAGGPGVEVLARLEDGTVVAVRQGHVLATAFHPELSGDDRFHRLFLSMVAG